MRREEYADRGYIPDYEITQAVLRRRLGFSEKRHVRSVTVHGTQIIIDTGIYRGTRVRYHLSQEEFKAKLGIGGWHPVLAVYASAWDDMIGISLAETNPEEPVRIR